MTDFVHLNTHSEYSMLQSAARIGDIISTAQTLGQKAVALTDHGNMFGMLEFYSKATGENLKPIIGCDLYMAPDDKSNNDYQPGEPQYHRLVLLAKNNAGYQNLMKICSDGYVDGYFDKPRIDRNSIIGSNEGLICLAGNVDGEAGYWFLHNEPEKEREILSFYKEMFGNSNLYLCVQDHGKPDEKQVNSHFLDLHNSDGYNLAAVNDIHYITPEDSEAQDVLMCIDGNYKLDDPDRPRMASNSYFMRSSEDMQELLGHYPEAIENTVRIAESCDVKIKFGDLYWPKSPIPEGFKGDNDEYLKHLAQEGVAKRYPEVTDEIRERMAYELEVMKKMKVAGYMLIVADFCQASRDMNVPVGPGRGSAVGSIVSYAVGITDVDPLRFNLLFERFLNPERVSMPDIDIDFSDLGRIKK